MEYVMVPVPEEFVAQVTQYLHWNTGSLPPDFWPPDAIARMLARFDDEASRFVMYVAHSAEDVVINSVSDVAAATGCSEREVLGLIAELNDAVRTSCGLPFAIATAVREGSTETGPKSWTVNMPGDIAKLILNAADGKDRNANDDPLRNDPQRDEHVK